MSSQPSILYHTFGCKLNFAETATIQHTMESKGYATFSAEAADAATHPDFVIINSCSVTEVADKKCRQYIRATNRRHPKAAIVVTGCYAQLKPNEVAALPGVRIVAGTDRKDRIPGLVEALAQQPHGESLTDVGDMTAFTPSCARGDRTRYFLKVQDGCDYRCSYCTIPAARGRSRSPEIGLLVGQAREAARQGGKEIVLTGVNIGDFGRRDGLTLLDLIKELDRVDGIERFRISSIEPNLLTDEIIEFCASSRRFMPHFHIPLQNGSNGVLALMRRRYRAELFEQRVNTIRRMMPDAFIGVDIITGSRGETAELFEESRAFIEGLDISRLHVFAYSERPGTDALKIPHKVSPAEQTARTHAMLALSDRKLEGFARRFEGAIRPVLLEHTHKDGRMSGFTDNYLRVNLKADRALDNRIVDVRLDSYDAESQTFNATIVSDNETAQSS